MLKQGMNPGSNKQETRLIYAIKRLSWFNFTISSSKRL